MPAPATSLPSTATHSWKRIHFDPIENLFLNELVALPLYKYVKLYFKNLNSGLMSVFKTKLLKYFNFCKICKY